MGPKGPSNQSSQPKTEAPAKQAEPVQTAHGLNEEPISPGLRSSATSSPAAIKDYGALEAQQPALDLQDSIAGKRMSEWQEVFGLYHVNRKTGEKAPFGSNDRTGSKLEMESRAQWNNTAEALGSAYPDDWTVQALPEDPKG